MEVITSTKFRNLYAMEGTVRHNDGGELIDATLTLTQIREVDRETFQDVLNVPDAHKEVLLDDVLLWDGDTIQLTKIHLTELVVDEFI